MGLQSCMMLPPLTTTDVLKLPSAEISNMISQIFFPCWELIDTETLKKPKIKTNNYLCTFFDQLLLFYFLKCTLRTFPSTVVSLAPGICHFVSLKIDSVSSIIIYLRKEAFVTSLLISYRILMIAIILRMP